MEPRPMYWSIRRELWENRSLYIAPLLVAGFALFGFFISTFRLARKYRGLATLDFEKQQIAIATPFSLAASVILFTGLIVGTFYCLDALYGERRDRSILFWKSLPVSDRTTVFSKASIPLFVQPLIGFVIASATQVVMFLGSTLILAAARGVSPALLWSRLPFLQMPLVMLYGLTVHMLWFAPIYAWLLLISAWAKRATFLWATLPVFFLLVIERLSLGTQRVPAFLKYRFMGAMVQAFDVNAAKAPIIRLSQLSPLKFLSTPGLWLGLMFAAVCLALAIRLRRRGEYL